MGRVYEARDMATSDRVAVKVIATQSVDVASFAARFGREAEAMSRVASRHITRFLCMGTDPATGMLYIVTEYLPGMNLQQWLARLGPLPPELALRIAAQACAALESVHAAGLVHRDIKPSNLFVEEMEGRARVVKLLDFGLAKLQPGAEAFEDWGSLTNTGELLGTPFYMSPEQVRGGQDVDARSDLWSLGVVLYKALTGRIPHEGIQGLGKLILAICQEKAAPVEHHAPWVPPEVSAVVARALALEPDHRFQRASELRAALDALLPSGGDINASLFVPLAPALRAATRRRYRPPGASQAGAHEATATVAHAASQEPTVTRAPAKRPELAPARPGQLPAPINRLIGREQETAELKQCVAGSRLVTLLGPGGTGKTRLALHVATELADTFEHGTGFVDLAPLTDPRAIPQAIALALGIREEPGQHLRDTLAVQLRSQHLLLVLDNCEHLVAACAEDAERLLAACPRLSLIATSREALAVASETTFLLAPLPVPEPASEGDFERVSHSDAIRLFTERARAVNPAFALSPTNIRPVAHVCRQLDGIPLAIELAAARMRAMTAEQLSEQIGDRFRLLAGVRRGASRRQQTLRALIDWSHDLLTAPERAVLRRLSVFQGGFSLQAAEAVCAEAGGPSGVEPPQVMDLLYALVSKSLVLVGEHGGGGRYRMLETLRHYARDQLQESGEAARATARHVDFFLRLAEEAEPALQRDAQLAWLARLDAEHGNLSAALDACEASPALAEQGLRLAALLGRFWWLRGHHSEGCARLERALERSTGVPPLLRARALCQLALLLPGLQRSHPVWEEALALYQTEGDARGVAFALIGVIGWEVQRGNRDQTRPRLQEAIALARAAGDTWLVARHLDELGRYCIHRKELAEAEQALNEGLALARALGDRWLMGLLLNSLSVLLSFQGDYPRTRAVLLECLPLQQAIGFKRGMSETLANLGGIQQLLGDFTAADPCFEESLAISLSLGNEELAAKAYLNLAENTLLRGKLAQARPLMKAFLERAPGLMRKELVAWGLLMTALIAWKEDAPEHALRFFAAEQALEESFGISLHPEWRRSYDETLAEVRTRLGESGAPAWTTGRRLRPEEAIQAALTYVSV